MSFETPPATRTVETTVRLNATPGRTINTFLHDNDLKAWWKVSRSLVEPRPGGVWSIAWDGYGEQQTNHSWTGVIHELDKGRLVVAPLLQNEPGRPLFGPLQLEIVAAPADNGCELTVLHHGYQHGDDWDWLHDAVVRGWSAVLGELQEWLASG